MGKYKKKHYLVHYVKTHNLGGTMGTTNVPVKILPVTIDYEYGFNSADVIYQRIINKILEKENEKDIEIEIISVDKL